MSATLKQVFPNYYENSGLFGKLINLPYVVAITPDVLNMKYIGQHSGNKLTSPLVDDLLTDGVLSDAALVKIASAAEKLYSSNWNKLWDAFIMDYNILDNYNASETESNTRTIKNTGDTTTQHGKITTIGKNESVNTTDTTDYGKKDTSVITHVKNTTVDADSSITYGKVDTINNDATDTEAVIPFNTDMFVNADKKTTDETTSNAASGTDNNKVITTTTGTDTDSTNNTASGTDKIINAQSTTGTDVATDSGNDVIVDNTTTSDIMSRTWSRIGNIGVNTNQDAIIEEFNLRAGYYMCDYIFKDLDKIMSSPIFG